LGGVYNIACRILLRKMFGNELLEGGEGNNDIKMYVSDRPMCYE
jgi:hypothetical protein